MRSNGTITSCPCCALGLLVETELFSLGIEQIFIDRTATGRTLQHVLVHSSSRFFLPEAKGSLSHQPTFSRAETAQ